MAKIVAVTGKGGVGKTTTSALIVKCLKDMEKGPILALDADPDNNLATVLGIPLEMTIGQLREDALKEMKNFPPGMNKSSYIEAGLHQIIVESENLDFIAMGRSEGPGCYCYINSLLRKFSDDLQDSYEWVVMDNEAGLEHLSRRTAARVDHLITVINNTPLSIDCAMRVQELVDGIQNEVRHRHYIINGVSDERLEIIGERCAGLRMSFLGSIPQDDQLEEAIFNGRSLFELTETPAVLKVKEMINKIKEL